MSCRQTADPVPRGGYEHMGAVLTDAGLQAGVSYRTVVEPRVRRLLFHWPTATTTGRFQQKVERFGLNGVLAWTHDEKLGRIRRLTDLFAHEGVETTEEARRWLLLGESELELLSLRGVGPKTVVYLRLLVGLPDIAVDRHGRAFAVRAGVVGPDDEVRRTLRRAAAACGLHTGEVDRALWQQGADLTSHDGDARVAQLRRALERRAPQL
jgi:hypothetical protein